MTWRKTYDKTLKGYFVQTRPLGNGYHIRAALYPDRKGEYYFGIHAYRGRLGYLFYRPGRSSGPGGLSVVTPALEMLEEAERFVSDREKFGYLTVWAESLRLYMIYRRVLGKRGYTESAESPLEWGPEMTKRI